MTKKISRAISAFFCAFALLPLACGAAQAWKPTKPIEIIVGVGPGGALDVQARLMQKILQPLAGVPVNVVNKVGSGSSVAWNYLNQHAGDAHYVSLTSPTLVSNAITGANPLTYTDVTPIAQLVNEYITFAVAKDAPIAGARDLLARLRKDSSSVSFGLATSLGNPNHVAIGLVAKAAGVDVKRLRVAVFNASPQALTAALGGHVEVVVSNASAPVPHIAAGRMRALAVTSPKRLEGVYANVPTWTELGLPVVSGFWRGIIGPRGMSAEQLAYWEDLLKRMVASPEWQQALKVHQLENTYMGGRESARVLAEQAKDYRAILAELGLAK
jgi:putative tricarboxylic transport membrane protein